MNQLQMTKDQSGQRKRASKISEASRDVLTTKVMSLLNLIRLQYVKIDTHMLVDACTSSPPVWARFTILLTDS